MQGPLASCIAYPGGWARAGILSALLIGGLGIFRFIWFRLYYVLFYATAKLWQ